MISANTSRLPESTANGLQQGKIEQQYHEPLQVAESAHKYSDHSDEPRVPTEINEQLNHDKRDIWELASKLPIDEVLPNAQELTHISGSQAADTSEVGNHYSVSIANWVPSRAQSEAPSRPQSRRSNCGKPMTRPIPAQDLRPQGVFEPITQRGTRSSKVKKSSNAPNDPVHSEAPTKAVASGQRQQKSRPSPKFFEDYKNFLANGQEMLEIMKDYEQQSQLIEVQKTEIKKLQDTSNSAIKQVQELESEKAGLTDKLKKFAELSSKYKKHMNDVVKAQKYLKSQANEIQKSANEAIESTKQAAETRAATEAALQKIEIVVNDAKSFRVPAESFAHGEQIAPWYIQLSLTEDSIQAEPRPRGRKPRASGRNPKATGWNPKASR